MMSFLNCCIKTFDFSCIWLPNIIKIKKYLFFENKFPQIQKFGVTDGSQYLEINTWKIINFCDIRNFVVDFILEK
jgi:hypothetical protein